MYLDPCVILSLIMDISVHESSIDIMRTVRVHAGMRAHAYAHAHTRMRICLAISSYTYVCNLHENQIPNVRVYRRKTVQKPYVRMLRRAHTHIYTHICTVPPRPDICMGA